MNPIFQLCTKKSILTLWFKIKKTIYFDTFPLECINKFQNSLKLFVKSKGVAIRWEFHFILPSDYKQSIDWPISKLCMVRDFSFYLNIFWRHTHHLIISTFCECFAFLIRHQSSPPVWFQILLLLRFAFTHYWMTEWCFHTFRADNLSAKLSDVNNR